MSQSQRILAALSDGEFHTTADLYARVGGCILHSRISELRRRGFWIVSERVPGETGPRSFKYRLVPTLTEQGAARERATQSAWEARNAEGGVAQSAQVTTQSVTAPRSVSVGGLLEAEGGRRDSAALCLEQPAFPLPASAGPLPEGGCSPLLGAEAAQDAGATRPSRNFGAELQLTLEAA